MQVRVPSINGSYSGEQSVQRTGTRTSEDAVMALPMNGESEGEKPLATNRRVLAIVVVADTLLSIAVLPIRKSNPISIHDNPR